MAQARFLESPRYGEFIELLGREFSITPQEVGGLVDEGGRALQREGPAAVGGVQPWRDLDPILRRRLLTVLFREGVLMEVPPD